MLVAVLLSMSAVENAGGPTQNDLEEQRKATANVRFQEADKSPITDKTVSVRLLDHHFQLGVEIGGGAVDLRRFESHVDGLAERFNTVVLDAADAESLARLIPLAEAHGLRIRCRVPTNAHDTTHVHALMAPLAGKVHAWEVVRDPIEAGMTAQDVAQVFATAREAAPNTVLMLCGSVIGSNDSATQLARFVEECLELEASVDAIGIGAPSEFAWTDPAPLLDALEALGSLDLPLYVIGIPASRIDALAPRLFAQPSVAGITCRPDQSTKEIAAPDPWSLPTMELDLNTGADGAISFAAYDGDYAFTVDGHRFTFRFVPGLPRDPTLTRPDTPKTPESFVDPFVARDAPAARAWQEKTRARLLSLIETQQPRADHPLDVSVEAPEDHGDYVQRTLTFTGNENTRVEATLTIPAGKGPFPAVVCLHGHGGDRFQMHDPSSLYGGLALGFAKRGVVTLAPSLWHCDYATNQLWNLLRVVDVLETLPEVDKDRIGCAGLSMGGEWTMWLTAMDPRIKAAVVSGWMCTTEGVLSVHNCVCWITPGLLEQCDVAHVHVLIAPRPLLFESAISDGCFPVRCTEEGYRKVLEGYRVLGSPMNVRRHAFPGGHAWSGAVAYPFMREALSPVEAPRAGVE